MLTILVNFADGTYRAKVQTKKGPVATCTAGPLQAAQAVTEKHYDTDAVATLRKIEKTDPLLDAAEVSVEKRAEAVAVYAFEENAKPKRLKTKGKGKAEAEIEAAPEQDPRWNAARRHALAIAGAVKITVGGCVAFGMELNALKVELGYVHGGPRSGARCNNSTLLPWKQLVAEQTGFSYERCQQFCKTAERVAELLAGSRAKALKDVKQLIKNPPNEWSAADYANFADVIGEHFEATTFSDLMIEVGLKKLPEPPQGGDDDDDDHDDSSSQQEFPFAAMLAAHDCVAQPIIGLNVTMGRPEQFVRYLHALPLDTIDEDEATGTPHITGLRELHQTVSRANEQIAEAIKAKQIAEKSA